MKIALLVAGEIRNDKIYFNELIKKYDMDVFLLYHIILKQIQ